MTHLQALRDVLLAAPAVTALVAQRIYPSRAPQGEAAKGPFVVLRVLSVVPYTTHDTPPAELLDAVRVQVDSYARGYDLAHQVGAAVDDVLGALAGPTLSATRESGPFDDYEDPTNLDLARAEYLVHRAAR